MGFLAHNSNPAQVFMGDTGSLALGAALAAMAAASGLFLPLLIASLIFAAEALSVMVQVQPPQLSTRVHTEARIQEMLNLTGTETILECFTHLW